ncbi:deoxynucleoside kinase [Mycolicibacterium mageritense]|uniref:deoxynucleoside kinase n=1 Tax=Mycolicibacterium mageritense TaxID=53462 RepID=UPI001E3DE38B|nr:deoxynucleoside kinase [Mycolicibacterium mageritense]
MPYVAIAGNVGTGKTTLAGVLADRLQIDLMLESVDDNPYLSRFYEDMRAWVFHLNMYFLGTRSQQLLEAMNGARPCICDRSLYEDKLFVDMALTEGVTTAENYGTFRQLYDVLEVALPRPALLIYLSAPPDILAERVVSRGRPYEQGISLEYLVRLQRRYDAWINAYALSPVLRLDTTRTTWHGDEAAQASVTTAVAAALGIA